MLRGAYSGQGGMQAHTQSGARRLRVSPRRKADRHVCNVRESGSPGDGARWRAVSQGSQATEVVLVCAKGHTEVRQSGADRRAGQSQPISLTLARSVSAGGNAFRDHRER